MAHAPEEEVVFDAEARLAERAAVRCGRCAGSPTGRWRRCSSPSFRLPPCRWAPIAIGRGRPLP